MAKKLLSLISAIVFLSVTHGEVLLCDPADNHLCFTINEEAAYLSPDAISPNFDLDEEEKRLESLRLGKRVALSDSLRLGKRLPLGDALRLGKKASLVDSMRLGKRAPLGDALRLGRRAALFDSMRLGKRSPLSNSMRLGKRPALYDSLRLGKRSPLSNSMRLGKRDEKEDLYDDKVDKRAALHDSMRLGKRGRFYWWQEFDKRKLLSDSLRLGKRSVNIEALIHTCEDVIEKTNEDEASEVVSYCHELLNSTNPATEEGPTSSKRAPLDATMRLG